MAEVLKSCPICNYPDLRECGNGIYQCDFCETHFDKDENIVLTEQEYIQTCNTEQLAEKLWEIYNAGKDDAKTYDTFEYFIDKEDVEEWLKEPHTPKE